MSNLKSKALKLTVENQELDQPKLEDDSARSFTKIMEDLPPELLTKILEFVTLDTAKQNSLLGYRLVNLQWKEIVDSLIEKKILSGNFSASPVMNFKRTRGQIQVRLLPTRFSAGGNLFPFNSLRLNDVVRSVANNAQERSSYPILSLQAFASRFGENLTSLCLQDQYRFPMSMMATMLSSMSSLKRLSLENVTNNYEKVFPTPPPLPCLTILELVLNVLTRAMNAINLYVWLFASVADRLVRLHLESTVPYPALQACHQYTYSDNHGETHLIATTSESAFKNLKELKICQPGRNFLLLSETPALQRFTVVDEYVHNFSEDFELADLIIFIDRCSSTLENLVLSFKWSSLGITHVDDNFADEHRPLLHPTPKIVLPRLKTLAVYYPDEAVNEMLLSEFLVKFPALKKLQFLSFWLNWLDFGNRNEDFLDHHQNENNEAVEVANDDIQLADEIKALKERLPPLLEYLSEIRNNRRVAENALDGLEIHPDDDAAVAQRRQLEAEIERLKQLKKATREEQAAIFRRLAALGVNARKVIVEQMLERKGYWNTCPKLRIVSVSKGDKPVGNVCVIQRTDNV